MNVLLFGATGMVGQGVLRECLLDAEVRRVQTVGRAATGAANPKLRELVRADLLKLSAEDPEMAGFDACFFCLGVSSVGMAEAEYTVITYDLTMHVAQILCALNPAMTFIYVSGAGTDSSENGRLMWARVKGRTENALLAMPFKAAYMFRPGAIQPMHGERPKVKATRIALAIGRPLFPLLRLLFPRSILTTEQIGRAMIQAARSGAPKKILEAADILDLARTARSV